jgi:AraC-like DNA-binding protein
MLDVVMPHQLSRPAEPSRRPSAVLVERLARHATQEGSSEPLPGLHLSRHSVPLEQVHSVVEPSLCIVAQGSKEFLLGEHRYRYDPAHYLLSTVELPHVGQVIDAAPERPFLGLRLELDPSLVSDVLAQLAATPLPPMAPERAVAVSALDADLLDAVVRLTGLLDAPADAPVLRPLITREIIYRLLQGEQGGRLRHLTLLGGYTPRIVRAIERLRHDFDQPLQIAFLAHEVGMSVSGFHHHFKVVTALSPLQFQKQLRLLEARRLMLGEGLDATRAAFQVGYRDAAFFNREYKNFFGAPPMRDVQRLRAAVREA